MPQIRDRRNGKIVNLPHDVLMSVPGLDWMSSWPKDGKERDTSELPILDAKTDKEVTEKLGGIPLRHAELVMPARAGSIKRKRPLKKN